MSAEPCPRKAIVYLVANYCDAIIEYYKIFLIFP